MLRTNVVTCIEDVPEEWVFEHFCNLDTKLGGQRVKIRSLWKQEKDPSMHIYPSTDGSYVFKDFSSGKFGGAIYLVIELYNCTRAHAVGRIVNAYNEYVQNGGGKVRRKFKPNEPYRVGSFQCRQWDNFDVKFWTEFHIGSKALDEYNIRPLAEYTLQKPDAPNITVRTDKHVYGYFRNDGNLSRIYTPKAKKGSPKFLTFDDYLQGSEQLTFDKKYCMIVSSMKDGLALKATKLPVDFVAPKGEKIMLTEVQITWLYSHYPYLICLLDNDVTGKQASDQYTLQYDIPSIELPLSKDLSDSGRDHGLLKIRNEIVTRVKNIL